VFNTLTNSGALRGLFMENGELYMNADFIHTGTLVAGRIPTLDDTKIASAATWNAVGPGIRSDLHLTATLPNAITMNALGIKATTTDGKWACLNSNGLEVYNGAIVVRNQAGQTVLDGNGIVTEGLGATKIYKPGQTGNYATIGGSYGDFNLYHNNQASPWFYIQDSGPYPGPAGMFVCGTNGFLNFSQSITEPYGTWDFTHCTPQNLNVVAKFA
jgi:hypothetical protein